MKKLLLAAILFISTPLLGDALILIEKSESESGPAHTISYNKDEAKRLLTMATDTTDNLVSIRNEINDFMQALYNSSDKETEFSIHVPTDEDDVVLFLIKFHLLVVIGLERENVIDKNLITYAHPNNDDDTPPTKTVSIIIASK